MNSSINLVEEEVNIPFSSQGTRVPYKTWPVYMLAFLKTLYQSIYGLALPNFLIYNDVMDADMIGVVTSMAALAYIVTPFIGQMVSKRTGYKNSILISLILSVIAYTFQIVFFTPAIFITMQLLEGLSIGFFWPNILRQITIWQKYSTPEQNNINFKRFNKSWNFGLLGGFLIGFILVREFSDDYIALVSAVIMAFILIPIGFFVDSEKKLQSYALNHTPEVQLEKYNSKQGNKNNNNLYIHIIIPVIIAWVLNLGYTTSKSMFSFNFPFNLKDASIGSEWRYLFVFGQQLLQVIGLNLVGPFNLKKKHKIVQVCLVVDLIMVIGMAISANIYYVIIATVMMGLSTGLKQGFVMKINFDHTSYTGDSKYINIGEIIAGIGFGVTPLWMGVLIVSVSYQWSYLILSLLSLGILIFYMMKMKNIDLGEDE
ncbi:MAG: MFS transporter [Promethearchaeota archaeon]